MLRHPEYTRDRIRHVVTRLHTRVYSARVPVRELLVSGPVDRIAYDDAQKLADWRPAKIGELFGPRWATYWFRLKTDVPQDWKGGRVELLWDSQSEATLWRDGQPAQGLNMTHGDRPDAVLFTKAKGGEPVELQIEMACNHKFGQTVGYVTKDDIDVSPYQLRRCELALYDADAWGLYHDVRLLSELHDDLFREGDTSEKTWAGFLMAELNKLCNALDLDDRATWPAARKIVANLYEEKNARTQFELSAVGHAHIDTAWLWPLAETYRKCVRTFTSQLAYMDEYPEYIFACSQAYQYAEVKRRDPKLYERIKKAVKGGRWNVVGGTWIEPDCNLPSGEALCRQFLYGQRFFEREFGQRCTEFWNPDVFGYNGQLPQIMRLSGATRFLTQKLSWNKFNRPPHSTFAWEGIDGSRVLTHFPPADTYNAFHEVGRHADFTTATSLRDHFRRHKDHDRARHGLMLYGFGDGGGGPTKTMIETVRRAKDLRGLPRTEPRTSEQFFDLLEKDVTDLPVQIGELYFELHRGTYTSQARIKRDNRKAECLLHDIEFLYAASDLPYPRAEIDALWEIVLLNQFHDILPGSSIGQVYADSRRQFEDVFQRGEALVSAALGGDGDVFVNTAGVTRADVVERRDGSLALVSAQPFSEGEVMRAEDRVTLTRTPDGGFALTNAFLAVELSAGGRLTRVQTRFPDETPHDALAGEGNVFELYEDVPNNWEAWDVDPFHLETRRDAGPAHAATVVREDPLRVELAFDYKLGARSTMRQTVRLDMGSTRVELDHDVEWRERQTMLKVAFPINARAMNATYEMQFGTVERPTHFNTSQDLAKYEVPMHRWFDLSEPDFGVAVLNDCKYGGSVLGNTMYVSLLRSPLSPDPEADQGAHRFKLALVPHGGVSSGRAIAQEALRFNQPMRRGAASPLTEARAIGTGDQDDDSRLVVDTVKRAEDSDALVLRVYECLGTRGVGKVRFGLTPKRAVFCNVLEDEQGAAEIDGNAVVVPFTPYQIVTLKVEF